jgi:cytochrome P450
MSASAQELYDPLLHSAREDLYEVYETLREEHPVYRSALRGAWCLTRFEDVQAAARDHETFSSEAGPQLYGQGDFVQLDPPRHDALRKLVRPVFVPRETELLADRIERHVEALASELAAREQFDIAQDFAWRLPVWVIGRLLGVPISDDERVQALVQELSRREPGEPNPPAGAIQAQTELRAYACALADERRQSPREDLLSLIVAGEPQGTPAADELAGILTLLIVGGSQTTANLLGNALWLLQEHDALQAALRQRPQELIDAVIEEALRLESPVQYFHRRATRAVQLRDAEIGADEEVLLVYGAANRDPRRFERPDELDVTRGHVRHLTFGEGIHFCLGAPLARLEARLALPAFLSAFDSYEIGAQRERVSTHVDRGFVRLPAVGRRAA